jgi:DNA invertase Pin-like site-specific DNA recombinase
MVSRAHGYIRLSKYDEGTTSPQRQRQAIEQLCKQRGWKLLEVYEDIDVSAYNGRHRPGLDKMLAHLGEVQAVVVYRIDRLARSSVGFARLLEAFQAAGVELAATDLQVDGSAAGTLIRDIVARMAQFESDTLSERSKRMHTYKQQQGEWASRTPFGFRRSGKSLEVDPQSFAVLENAARRYVGGESLRRIAPDLGMTHPALSKRLKTDRVLNALPHHLATSLAQAMSERGRTGTRAKRSLLGGLARCGICGEGMTVVGDDRGREGRKPFASYSCKVRAHASISKPWLDQYVTEAVIGAIDSGKLVKRLERRRRTPSKAMASSEIEARLEILETDFYEKGIIPRDRYLARREALLRRLSAVREAEQDRGIDLPAELARNLDATWPKLTNAERRRIIVACVESITVTKATGHGPVDPGRVAITWR